MVENPVKVMSHRDFWPTQEHTRYSTTSNLQMGDTKCNRTYFLGPDTDIGFWQGYVDTLKIIAEETETRIAYDETGPSLVIQGNGEDHLQKAYQSLEAIANRGHQPSRPKLAIGKPDRPGKWGERRVQRSQASAATVDPDDFDLEPATLPTPRMLKLNAIDEFEALRHDLPVAMGQNLHQVVPRDPYTLDKNFYTNHLLSARLHKRSSVFRVHARGGCQHPPSAESQLFSFEPGVLAHMTPAEEIDAIYALRRLAQISGACLAYKKSEDGIRVMADTEERMQEVMKRLNALQTFLQDNNKLPIPASSAGIYDWEFEPFGEEPS
ncbi:hypothetical protein DFJ77DRAFT_438298 [Powellomyces hirtus]|nr:hypothetical protein DFJ77DRAFT_438298 [Powellomyces hirtus]